MQHSPDFYNKRGLYYEVENCFRFFAMDAIYLGLRGKHYPTSNYSEKFITQ